MIYNLTYSCGHAGTVKLFGKTSERESKLKWFSERGLCPDCYKKHKAAAYASRYSLPDLEGSCKQVAWAGNIRSKYIAINKKHVDTIFDIVNNRWNDAALDAAAAKTGKAVEDIKKNLVENAIKSTAYTVLTTTSASWIINNLRHSI